MMKTLPRLIGVIHLPALGGAPGASDQHPADALQKAGLLAVKEAQLLTRAGFEAIILENFGDAPFYKTQVPPETTASMAVIAAAVREATSLPLGINVLRNDARAALAIATVTGCDFIRINVLNGLVATDQGLIEGQAAELIRERLRLHSDVAILADAHVKHARTLSSDDIGLAVEEAALRSSADGVIVTGDTTGRSVDLEHLARASEVANHHRIPLFIGSGATPENLSSFRGHVHGIIVGSTLRQGGKAGAPLDAKRMKDLVKAFQSQLKRATRKPARKTPKKR